MGDILFTRSTSGRTRPGICLVPGVKLGPWPLVSEGARHTVAAPRSLKLAVALKYCGQVHEGIASNFSTETRQAN